DGKGIITGGAELNRWDALAGRKLAASPPVSPLVIERIVVSPDGKRTLTRNVQRGTTGGHEARLWDAATLKPLGAPLQHRCGGEAVAFAPTGKTVLTGGSDGAGGLGNLGEVREWDVATGKLLRELPQHGQVSHLSFSPDGKALLASGRGARLWDAATFKPLLP